MDQRHHEHTERVLTLQAGHQIDPVVGLGVCAEQNLAGENGAAGQLGGVARRRPSVLQRTRGDRTPFRRPGSRDHRAWRPGGSARLLDDDSHDGVHRRVRIVDGLLYTDDGAQCQQVSTRSHAIMVVIGPIRGPNPQEVGPLSSELRPLSTNYEWERLAAGVYRCRLPFLDVTVGGCGARPSPRDRQRHNASKRMRSPAMSAN